MVLNWLVSSIWSVSSLVLIELIKDQSVVCLQEDGFLKGKAIIEKADGVNNFNIFGSSIDTYRFAIQSAKS